MMSSDTKELTVDVNGKPTGGAAFSNGDHGDGNSDDCHVMEATSSQKKVPKTRKRKNLSHLAGMEKSSILMMGNGLGGGHYQRTGLKYLTAYAKAFGVTQTELKQTLLDAPGKLAPWDEESIKCDHPAFLKQLKASSANQASPPKMSKYAADDFEDDSTDSEDMESSPSEESSEDEVLPAAPTKKSKNLELLDDMEKGLILEWANGLGAGHIQRTGKKFLPSYAQALKITVTELKQALLDAPGDIFCWEEVIKADHPTFYQKLKASMNN